MRDGPPATSTAQEPPAPVAAALAAADVFIAPTSKSLSHTKARKAATDGGARGATLPGVTASMLARLMACDFDDAAAALGASWRGCSPRPARRASPARAGPTCGST